MGRHCGYRRCHAERLQVSLRSAAIIPVQAKSYRHDSRDVERVRFECRRSSFDARRKRANRAELRSASACRPQALPLLAGTLAGERAELGRSNRDVPPTSPDGAWRGGQSRFVHTITNRRICAGRARIRCMRSGRRASTPGPCRTPWRAPPENEYGGKRQNLLGLHPLCGKKVLPTGH